MDKADVGLIGLAVMGENLARNIADKKKRIVVYNRTSEKTDNFINSYGNSYISGEKDLKSFVASIEKPRKIILMVKAGAAVDAVINGLIQLLDKDDIIIDCGNSNYRDTQRRYIFLKEKGLNFVGCGVSGGEEGALNGPSLMPGCTKNVYEKIKDILELIAAKDFNNKPCVTHIGKNGSGHFVKMVHNGIEYGVMQMMAEIYDILRKNYALEANKISEIFKKLNQGKLNSYLFEISEKVLKKRDEETDNYLINMILDKAGQKGTGKWTVIDALERGVNVSCICEAVFARYDSSKKELRNRLSTKIERQTDKLVFDDDAFVKIESALYIGMICCYAQGFDLIKNAAKDEDWEIDLAEISRIWEGGCIIRAKVLNNFYNIFTRQSNVNLLESNFVVESINEMYENLKFVCSASANISCPCLFTALNYVNSMGSEKSPANFIQGLRDCFGAHTYERIDKEGNYHTDWD